MKKGLVIIFLIISYCGFSQNKATKKKDTIKTEVIEVVSKYNPKIADANKITKNPEIILSDKNKKKKLTYSIFSAPVASTFIPKSGVVKGINVGVRERIYDNYLALGYGNYNSPYAEIYLNTNQRFENQFGLHAKYNSSLDNVENTLLDSDFSNFIASAFFKKEERYFDWKITVDAEKNKYNWYGLSNQNISATTLNFIEEQQNYNFIKASGEVDFIDAYVDNSELSISHFSDNFKSREFLINLKTIFDFPIDRIFRNANNLYLKTNLEYLSGSFERDYAYLNRLNYTIFTTSFNPEYKSTFNGFSLKLGAKFFASFDTENKINNFLIYPDVLLQKSFDNEKYAVFVGATGGLQTNTFKSFTEENPFVSPTLLITQTSEKYNTFIGFNGIINNSLSFNVSASFKDEEDKPLFVKNNSKSDGVNTSLNGNNLLGYEFGNSFNIVYDNIKTTSFLAELQYDVTKRIEMTANVEYQSFSTTNQLEAWNLPNIQASFTTSYKNNKWFAKTNIFYVGERKDVTYTTIYPSTNSDIQTLASFVDINVNGGYHFNDKFSAFLRVNNILNNNYERFANFNIQGFQVLGGLTYKFDF
ncbi:MAG: TonB-dependent receptor [Flavobacteriaceae bacterium]|nr:TonB-dependent receptor [Flavobacteriaceae bacterium]